MRPVVRTVSSLGAGVQVAAGQFEVLRAQRVEDVVDGEVVGAQAVGIHHRTWISRRAPPTMVIWPTPLAFSSFCLICLSAISVTSRSERLARDGDLQDGRGVGIELLHHRLLGGLRQVAARSG